MSDKLRTELAAAVSAYEAQLGNTRHYRTLAENQERRAKEAESALAQEREKREAAERDAKWTHDWYRRRWEKLRAEIEPTPYWPRVCDIMANGSTHAPPPTEARTEPETVLSDEQVARGKQILASLAQRTERKPLCRWCGQSWSNHVDRIGVARDCAYHPSPAPGAQPASDAPGVFDVVEAYHGSEARKRAEAQAAAYVGTPPPSDEGHAQPYVAGERFYCCNCWNDVIVDEDGLCKFCGGETCTRRHVLPDEGRAVERVVDGDAGAQMTQSEALDEAMRRWPFADSWFASAMTTNNTFGDDWTHCIGYRLKSRNMTTAVYEFRGKSYEDAFNSAPADDGDGGIQ